jgi:signal transduction histidine kinase
MDRMPEMTRAVVAAYFDRNLAALQQLAVPASWLRILELHWAGALAEAREAARATLAKGALDRTPYRAMVLAEETLLSAKLGLGAPAATRGLSDEATLVIVYARFLHFFYVDHRQAWRALWRLLLLSVRVPRARMLPTVLFLMGHLMVMATRPRVGYLVASMVFRSAFDCRTAGPAGCRFSEAVVFACFSYTTLIAGRFDRLQHVSRRCRQRVPPDPFYLSIFSASALYAAAFTGDVARTEIISAQFKEAFAQNAMARYRSVAQVAPLLPLALRGYGHLVQADCEAIVAAHQPEQCDAIVNSQFYRITALVALSVGHFNRALERVRLAEQYRQKTKSFHAWRRIDQAIRQMAEEQLPFAPDNMRLFGAAPRFDSSATLGVLLLRTIGAIPGAFSEGMLAFEERASALLREHLDCPGAELRASPVAVTENVPQLRIGSRFLVFAGVMPERAPLVEQFLATISPVFGIIERSIRDILRLKEENERASRDAAIARATQMLAHDVRRPFSMLQMAIATLAAARDGDELRGTLDVVLPEVVQAATSVNGLISDVLGIGSDPKLEVTRPEVLVHACLHEILSIRPDSDVALEYSFAADAAVSADPRQLHRVLCNIVLNALESMDGRGRLSFRSARIIEDKRPFVELVIGNDGPPIARDDAERIFEAFFTRGKRNGTGLGLAIAQRIVAAHGGRIRCRPLDAGAEFRFTIPAAPAAQTTLPPCPPLLCHSRELARPAQATPAHSPPPVAAGDGVRPEIALIDDSRAFLFGWRTRLGAHAHLHLFLSPEQFWSAVARDETLLARLSALITDYRFANSVETGVSFARALRTRQPGLPIAISSSGLITREETADVVDLVIDKEAITWSAVRPLLSARSSTRHPGR